MGYVLKHRPDGTADIVLVQEVADSTVVEANETVPRGNASRDEWAAYAASRGIHVDDEMTRTEIKALVQ
ncbi:hypothetical protein [Brevibacterium otitidis]|uniref:Lsr2 protein n=1 Tax=Brevibacterium otitidis TaxID=53364 RepID=A0ABV5X107_9MICO|nr:hypothetical protein GCM10023233_04910 [Brevibacterium otitidis]